MSWIWLMSLAGAYLCGSAPFALLLGKMRGVDIRQVSSGNIGATNLGRALGRRWGLLCFVLDVSKGLLPVLLLGWVMGYVGRFDLPQADQWRWLAVALAAVVGHVYPVWLAGRGGKGMATGLGVLLGVAPMLTVATVAALVTWVIVLGIFGYVSLASMVAAILLPGYILAVATLCFGQSVTDVEPMILATLLIAALIIWRHRANIGRIAAGSEPRIGRHR